MGDVAGVTIQEQLRDDADEYERAADINFTDHEWPVDSPHVQGNLSSASRMRAAADRIDALEAAMREISDRTDDPNGDCDCSHCLKEVARNALESS